MTRAPPAALACLAAAAALAHAQPLDPATASLASAAAIGSRPANVAFTEASGRRMTLADFRGKPLVVSFVYTGCTQVCPTTTRVLARAVKEARGVVGDDAFRVASIGFDVPNDNPVSLRVFARQQGIEGDARWSLLAPDPGAVESLTRDLGFSWRAQAGGFEHVAQVTVLDAEGRVRAQVQGDTFAAPMLVQPLRALAMGESPAGRAGTSILERVRLLCSTYDPATGGYRLDYRLFIELGVGMSLAALTLGFLLRERRRSRPP